MIAYKYYLIYFCAQSNSILWSK